MNFDHQSSLESSPTALFDFDFLLLNDQHNSYEDSIMEGSPKSSFGGKKSIFKFNLIGVNNETRSNNT
jgi:hypothetical protein